MRRQALTIIVFFLAVCNYTVLAQNNLDEVGVSLSYEEFIGYVKRYHPVAKQANLITTEGEASLLKARGAFDPKIEVDYDRKKFKDTEYYDELNATFKIPTWYGVEFKANFEENTGVFLDPSLTVPEDGLYSAGVSFSVAQGFLINERMANLKKAKYLINLTKAERDLAVNNLIFEASVAYFRWLGATTEKTIYQNFLANAQQRFNGIKRSVETGAVAAIDSIEAKIILDNRKLGLEQATLKARKASLQVSNYLWIENVPLVIEDEVIPQQVDATVFGTLLLNDTIEDDLINHPKLLSLEAKEDILQVDRRLKQNKLLPRLDLEYNFLTADREDLNSFNTDNYKAGVRFSVPLFLRKERGDLKLANLKVNDIEFEQSITRVTLQNKILSAEAELASLKKQITQLEDILENYRTLLNAEERKFELGESSLFLINSREQKLIETALKSNKVTIDYLNANASYLNVLGRPL